MSKPVPSVEALLPLKPDVFTILLVLAAGDAHGYAMMRAADERVGRRGALQPGSLYRLLRHMLELDLIVESRQPRTPAGGDTRRRCYGITRFGRHVAAAESRRMEKLVGLSRDLDLIEGESR